MGMIDSLVSIYCHYILYYSSPRPDSTYFLEGSGPPNKNIGGGGSVRHWPFWPLVPTPVITSLLLFVLLIK